MVSTADVVVIGGGSMGTSTAWRLAERGLKVTLVEKGVLAGGSTGKSSAIVRQHYSNETTARMARMAAEESLMTIAAALLGEHALLYTQFDYLEQALLDRMTLSQVYCQAGMLRTALESQWSQLEQ